MTAYIWKNHIIITEHEYSSVSLYLGSGSFEECQETPYLSLSRTITYNEIQCICRKVYGSIGGKWKFCMEISKEILHDGKIEGAGKYPLVRGGRRIAIFTMKSYLVIFSDHMR